MYGCENWTIKKPEHQWTDAFRLWAWRLLRVPWTARRSNQSILKEISPEYSLEGLMWKLKLQHFGHLMAKNWLTGKDPDAGKHWRQEEKGTIEDETVEWHHWLDGHEFKQTSGIADGQGSLACCSPWGQPRVKTWLSNWTDWLLHSITNVHWPHLVYPFSHWCILSAQFSRSDMSDSLRPHESQHARPPCPSPTPEGEWSSFRVCSFLGPESLYAHMWIHMNHT